MHIMEGHNSHWWRVDLPTFVVLLTRGWGGIQSVAQWGGALCVEMTKAYTVFACVSHIRILIF